jgi:hypothetical protein
MVVGLLTLVFIYQVIRVSFSLLLLQNIGQYITEGESEEICDRPNLSSSTMAGVDSASNRNEYQKSSWA